MRILVIGGSGILGSALSRMLSSTAHVYYTYNHNPMTIEGCERIRLDLLNPEDALNRIREIQPQVIFHAAANQSVDWHETEKESASRLNVMTTRAISDESARLGFKLVYFSTAFVFPGGPKVYTENDPPNPINYYGMTKNLAEEKVRANPDHLILRTDQIYGWGLKGQKTTFVPSVLGKLQKGQRSEVCVDWFNCPTYVEDLAQAAIRLVSLGRGGTYHATGSSFLNRYEWALLIAEKFGMDKSLVVPIHSSTLNLAARRPNAHLSNAKIISESGVKMRGVGAGIDSMKAFLPGFLPPQPKA